MKELEALVILNADTDIDSIRHSLVSSNAKRVLFLSTCFLYDNEKSNLARFFEETFFFSFADFLTESEMVECDSEADRFIENLPNAIEDFDAVGFWQKISLIKKNNCVRKKIGESFKYSQSIVDDNLGIVKELWEQNADPGMMIQSLLNGQRKSSALRNFFSFFRQNFFILSHRGKPYAFVGSVKRLNLAEGASVKKVGGLSFLINAIKTNQICTTIHQFSRLTLFFTKFFRIKLFTYVDGHHPSNYPKSYLHGFHPKINTIVSSVFTNVGFFRKNQFKVIPPDLLIAPFYFKEVESKKHPQRILIAMNHAGDWTSLINRSDTDILIRDIVDLASNVPDKFFRLRLHPTMNTLDHEGIRACERIRNYLSYCNLKNLEISNFNLESDLAWSEFVITEYSQVLIDSWRFGKPGASVNLTSRRSFMKDYSELGFHDFHTIKDLVKIFNSELDWNNFISNHNSGVRRFNIKQEEWINLK